MKKIFYVAVATIVFAAWAGFVLSGCAEDCASKVAPEGYRYVKDGRKCKQEEIPVPPPPPEDSSGFCKVIFQNTDEPHVCYEVRIDNVMVKDRVPGGNATFPCENVQAGTRTLYAIQISGKPNPSDTNKWKEERVKILTDSVFTWRFP